MCSSCPRVQIIPEFTVPARRVPTMPGSRSGSVWNIMDSEAENRGRRPVPPSLSIICENEKTKKIRISKKVQKWNVCQCGSWTK